MKYLLIIWLILGITACKVEQKSKDTSAKETDKGSKTSGNKPVKGKTTEDSLDIKIGQMILVGINDRTALASSDPLIKELASRKIGGIALFEKNVSKKNSKENLKKLISALQSHAPIPLFISIDEEGGNVHRLKEKYGFPKMPSAAYLGSVDNEDSTLFYNRRLAALMAELGINFNFAPVVDLALNKNNPIIYKVGRSFSDNPEVVTKHALLSIRAQHEYGVKTILKHFPGHGSSSTDTHAGMTEVTDQWKIIELLPFKNIIRSGKCDAIMTAHVVNCHLDTSCLPGTLSKTVITDLLRNLLDFNGVVVSDDMQMYAISKNYGLENAIRLSILAGVDVLLFGNNVNETDRITGSEIHAIVKKLVKSGQISEDRIDESYQRIMALKKKKVR